MFGCICLFVMGTIYLLNDNKKITPKFENNAKLTTLQFKM